MEERILTVDLTATGAQAREVAPTTSRERDLRTAFARASQNVATSSMLLDTLPPPSADGVDRLHCELGEIITIAIMQLTLCTQWRLVEYSTSILDRSRVDWQKAMLEPFTVETTPSPTWASSHGPLGKRP
jgi:hypothetical protein